MSIFFMASLTGLKIVIKNTNAKAGPALCTVDPWSSFVMKNSARQLSLLLGLVCVTSAQNEVKQKV